MYIPVKEDYLVTRKILLGHFFDRPADDVFITIREPSTRGSTRLEKVFKEFSEQREPPIQAFVYQNEAGENVLDEEGNAKIGLLTYPGKLVKEGNTEKILEAFIELLPQIIIDHDFYKDETNKMSPEEVVAVIEDKLDLLLFIMDEFKQNMLFTRGKKSDGK